MAMVSVPDGLRFAEIEHWRLRTLTPTAGIGVDGRQNWIRRENRIWTGKVKVRGAWGRNQGPYLAFLDDLAGPAGTFRLPVSNEDAPGSGGVSLVFLMNDAGTEFRFDTGTSNMQVSEGFYPTLSVSAPVSATILTTSDNDLFRPGMKFSHDDFLYRVSASDASSITINPPLRAPIASGQTLNVEAPYIRVKLASDEAAAGAHAPERRGGPYVLDVIEAFER